MKKSIKKITIALSFVITIGIVNLASSEGISEFNTSQSNSFPNELAPQKAISLIDLHDISTANHGKIIMEEASIEVMLFIKNARNKFKIAGIDINQLSQDLKITYENSKRLNPQYIGMMEAIADESGINALELFALGQTDYTMGRLLKQGITQNKNAECNSMASINESLKQTNESASIDSSAAIILKTETSIVAMIGFSPIGQALGKNVGITINSINHRKQGVEKDHAMATDLGSLVDAIAKTENVKQALKIVEQHRAIVGVSFTIADKHGDAVLVEMSKNSLLINTINNSVTNENHNSQKALRQINNGAFSHAIRSCRRLL